MVSSTWSDTDGTTIEVEITYGVDSERISQIFGSVTEIYEDPEEFVEKLKWKDRTFEKSKSYRVLNIRRDIEGKSGRLTKYV